MVITSVDNEKILNLKKLNNKKYRDDKNLFLIEGEHLILEAQKSGFLKELYTTNLNYSSNINTYYITDKVMKFISNLDNPTNMLGVCFKKSYTLKGNKIVYLDNVQDPGNLGTIIRSCVAFNIDTLILSNDTCDLYNSKVIRATQGLLFNLNIIYGDINLIENLKKDNYKIYGTKVNNGKSLKKVEKNEKFVIIMGNEGNGMSDAISKLCDEFIYIDMNPLCESLNVGVATSIILYEFVR